ncbi:hypothetical protein Q1695_007117 [Nippostrongylus brasiliensis]|nr:hypothetical protein Q1695_007117 [Nippostrongylus brasiliensis]
MRLQKPSSNAPIPWHRAVGHLARREMSVVQPPPHLMQLAQTQVALTPDDVDLQGGRLIDVVEEEEIDATDGCRVQVITYRIESADGTEQLTKTIRRKVISDNMLGPRKPTTTAW